jgi:hypothetical protein
VLAILGAELARAVAFRAFAERVWDFAVPMADRTCVKIAMASITFGHHELPMGSETFLAQRDAEDGRVAANSAGDDISPFIPPVL